MTQSASPSTPAKTELENGFSLQQLQELQLHGQHLPSLGSIVSWGMKNIVIGEAELRTLLDDNNLAAVKIPAIRNRKALNRALKEMVDDELIRLVTDNKEHITYMLIKISNDRELEDVIFNKRLKVTYKKETAPGEDPLTFSDVTAESILRPLITKYQTCYVSGDISRFILLVTIRDRGGIPLRPEGGMYFVPTTSHEIVLDLRAFMEALAKQQNALAYLSMFNVIDDSNAQQDMQRHAQDALKGELRDLTHELDKLVKNPNRVVRDTTVQKYLEEANRIGEEAALYKDLIALEAQDITQALNVLRQKFRALTTGNAEPGSSDDPFALPTNSLANFQIPPFPERDNVQPVDPGF